MPAHAEGGGEVPDHIVFMVKSSDVAEIRHAANWVLSRRRDLEMHAQRMGKRGKKKTSTNPFESDDEGDSGFLSERYKVFFVPHITVVGEKILADSGILSSCDIGELHLDLVPLDDDLLSSEIENLLMENSVDGITSGCHFTVARSIMKLQRQYGIIQNVKGIGKAAQSVIEKIFSERIADARDDGEDAAVYDESEGQNIDTMVVIDREVDFVTPLLTPLTYEGLIDEVIGIQNGYIKVDPTLVEVEEVRLRVDWKEKDNKKGTDKVEATSSQSQKKVAVPLNSSDTLFDVVRSQNIEKLGSFLQDQAKSIRESYASFRQNKDASITEIHQFVKQIPGLTQNYKSLNQHINLAELVKKTTDGLAFRQRWQTERAMLEGETCYEYLEDLIAADQPVLSVLKLTCLQSLTNGGLKSSKFDSLRRDIIQSYGFDLMVVLNRLEAVGAIKRREISWTDSGNTWNTLRKNLRLIKDNVNVYEPDDISYVSSGYAPLSVRLLQALLLGGPGADTLRTLARVTEAQQEKSHPLSFHDALNRKKPSPHPKDTQKKVLLVYFLGGITFMEIAALRFLSKSDSFPFSIVICTTSITSGVKLLGELF